MDNIYGMIFAGIVRHGATVLAGWLLATGFADNSQSQEISAGIIAISAVAWSAWQKYGHSILLAKAKNAGIVSSIAACLLLFSVNAHAADLIASVNTGNKVFASTPCTLTDCSGFYVGFNFTGIATNANVIGNGINGSLAAGGQNIGAQVGYQFWNGTWFFGPEFFADYTIGGSALVAGYSAPKFIVSELLKVGAPFSSLFGSIAPADTTGLPSILTANTIAPYVFVGAAQRSWGSGFASGAGVTFLVSSHWFADMRYMNVQYTGGNQASPVQNVPQENLITASLNYKF